MAEHKFIDAAYAAGRKVRIVHMLLRVAKARGYPLIVNLFRLLGWWTVRLGVAHGFFGAGEAAEGMGETILQGQDVHAAPPGSLRTRTGQNGWQPWRIFWARYREARLVSSSLALMDGKKRVMLESVWGAHFASRDPAYRYVMLPRAERLEGPWTSLVTRWAQPAGYFHWLMDSLPRLALLDRFPPETGILVPSHPNSYQTETLDLLGLAGRCRPTTEKHLVVEDFYFTSPTALTGCDNPYAVRFLRENFLKHADSTGPVCEKLFIRRTGKTRRIINEQEVADFFANRGWTFLDMEDLSFTRQVWLFSNLRMVCGMHGAAFTNLLWCRPGCKVLELFASTFINGCYEGIAAYANVDHKYVVSPGDYNYAMTVDMKILEGMVDAMERS